MVEANNNYNGEERRNHERRDRKDRRNTVRFEDMLGRRSGEERRTGYTNSNEIN